MKRPKNLAHAARLCAAWFALFVPLITACGRADPRAQVGVAPAIAAVQQPAERSAPISAPGDSGFANRLQQVANEYLSYALVDRLGHWAPELCSWAPTSQFSEAAPEAPHAQKIYFLFVKDPDNYKAPEATQPVGQAIVKQSWAPREVTTYEIENSESDQSNQPVVPYASRDGKLYRGDHQTGLFVMLKLDPDTPGTDAGWLYGTVTADGKKVISAGRVESCMECHQQSKGDRVFGMKRNASPANSVNN